MREVLAHVFGDVPAGTIARLAADMEALSDAVEAKDLAAQAGTAREDGGGRQGASA